MVEVNRAVRVGLDNWFEMCYRHSGPACKPVAVIFLTFARHLAEALQQLLRVDAAARARFWTPFVAGRGCPQLDYQELPLHDIKKFSYRRTRRAFLIFAQRAHNPLNVMMYHGLPSLTR